MRNKITKIVFLAIAFGLFGLTADSALAQNRNRGARREYRQDVRRARREYRNDIREARRDNRVYRNSRGRNNGYYNRRYPTIRNNRRYYAAPRRGINNLRYRNRY